MKSKNLTGTGRRIWITGGAGTGKSAIVAELARRGYPAVDLDEAGICEWINKKTGQPAAYDKSMGEKWFNDHRWEVAAPKLVATLDSMGRDRDVYVGGKAASSQMGEVARLFDRIYVLTPDDAMLDKRLRTRQSRFAKTVSERGAMIAGQAAYRETCLRYGAIPLANNGTLGDVVAEILKQ